MTTDRTETLRTESVIDAGNARDVNEGLGDLEHYMKSAGRLAEHARQLEHELAQSAQRESAAVAEAERLRGCDVLCDALKTSLAVVQSSQEIAVALALEKAANAYCTRCAEGEPVIFHAGYWRHMRAPTKVNATTTICEGWLECNSGKIHALSAPAISAEARRVVEDAKQCDALHIAICQAVGHLNMGEEVPASAILRQALVSYADAAIAAGKKAT